MPVDINNDIIDLKTLCRVISERKWKFIILQLIVVAISIIYCLCTPKVYQTYVEIAPEFATDHNNDVENMLKLAGQTNFVRKDVDAIYPLMYPEIVCSEGFCAELFKTKVATIDGKTETTYYDYLKNHRKQPFWQKPVDWIKKLFASSPKESVGEKEHKKDFVHLTREQKRIVEVVQSNVVCVVDRKMGILNIIVFDQDPMVSTLIADTISAHLKSFIIDYRTNKARTDYNFCKKAYEEAKVNYEEAKEKFVKFASANLNAQTTEIIVKRMELDHDVQAKRKIMESAEVQMFSMKAKVQESMPVFSVIQRPSVPTTHYSPKWQYVTIFLFVILNLLMLGCIFRRRLIKLID